MKLRWKTDKWKFCGSCADGQKFEISGVNVWEHEWHNTKQSKAEVKDPKYGQSFEFNVYTITHNSKTITFAAGEFSNCIWGFYTNGY